MILVFVDMTDFSFPDLQEERSRCQIRQPTLDSELCLRRSELPGMSLGHAMKILRLEWEKPKRRSGYISERRYQILYPRP
jgi:hypothetical protein